MKKGSRVEGRQVRRGGIMEYSRNETIIVGGGGKEISEGRIGFSVLERNHSLGAIKSEERGTGYRTELIRTT